MRTIRLTAWIAAMCGIAAAQTGSDSAGVTVALNGAAIMHRTGVAYPASAIQHGIQGNVSVQLKLDATGNVSDAQVLSGPEELRRAVLESVLDWHFSREVAGTTRMIQIAFEVPKAALATSVVAITPARPAPGAGVAGPQPLGRIRSIHIMGMQEGSASELLSRLPMHQGDEWTSDTEFQANLVAKQFDEHMSVRISASENGRPGEIGVLITTTPNPGLAAATPGRIKVGGNVQSMQIINKVAPVYPEAAKAHGVSGLVQLAVVIGKDGTVQSVQALGGPAELISAAQDAVRQWKYHPTQLNGSPVDVETTIDVNFTLNQ